MNKFVNFFFNLFLLSCVFCSCSKHRSGYIERELFFPPLRDVHLSDGKYGAHSKWYQKRLESLTREDDILNDEVIKFLSFIETKKLNIDDKKLYFDRFSQVPIELFPIDSQEIDLCFSGKFLEYFPEYRGSAPSLPFRLELSKWPYPQLIANDSKLKEAQKSNFYIPQHIFKIYYKRIPTTLEFPRDIYTSILLLNSGNRKIIHPDYIFIDLPEALGVNVKFDRLLFQQVDSLQLYSNGFRWAPLRLRRLLLNPAFVSVYEDNIRIIWDLYLFKIKYQSLNDTLQCLQTLTPWIRSCLFDFYIFNVLKYLKTAFDIDPMMYQSYFELILWQMYQPNDFEIKDSKGKERSFRFTSTNPKYPGMYEVKFDIYQPYEFKVKKR